MLAPRWVKPAQQLLANIMAGCHYLRFLCAAVMALVMAGPVRSCRQQASVHHNRLVWMWVYGAMDDCTSQCSSHRPVTGPRSRSG